MEGYNRLKLSAVVFISYTILTVIAIHTTICAFIDGKIGTGLAIIILILSMFGLLYILFNNLCEQKTAWEKELTTAKIK